MKPAEFSIVKCRKCQAQIFFAKTNSGSSTPLNAVPERRITIQPLEPGQTQHRAVWVDTYTSHFATCPGAEEMRRARKAKK